MAQPTEFDRKSLNGLLGFLARFGLSPTSFIPPLAMGCLAAAFEGLALHLFSPLVRSMFQGPGSAIPFPILLAVVFVCFEAKLLLWHASTVSNSRLCRALADRMRRQLFEACLRLEKADVDSRNKGRLQSTLLDATEALVTQLLAAHDMAVTALMLAVYAALMLAFSWKTTVLLACAVPFMQAAIRSMAGRIGDASRRQREAQSDLAGLAADVFNNVHLVKSASNETREGARFASLSKRAVDAGLEIDREVGFVRLAQESMSLVLLASLAGLSRLLMSPTDENLPALLIYVYLLRRSATSINVLARANTLFYAAHGAIIEIEGLLLSASEQPERDGTVEFKELREAIEFRSVSFAHPGKPAILDGLTLRLPRGRVTALVGRSGSGKTTLLNLLLRLARPSSGTILLDGLNLADVKIASWLGQAVLISQEAPLFNASLRSNVIYPSEDCSDEEVLKALAAARLDVLLRRLPDGLDAVVGDRGARLSGGERQRLSIARAFYHKPKVLLLDEATSALDSETEAAVQESLGQLSRGSTTLLVAHRLSTIKGADWVVVMDKGRICEEGPWERLMESKGKFYSLYSEQSGS